MLEHDCCSDSSRELSVQKLSLSKGSSIRLQSHEQTIGIDYGDGSSRPTNEVWLKPFDIDEYCVRSFLCTVSPRFLGLRPGGLGASSVNGSEQWRKILRTNGKRVAQQQHKWKECSCWSLLQNSQKFWHGHCISVHWLQGYPARSWTNLCWKCPSTCLVLFLQPRHSQGFLIKKIFVVISKTMEQIWSMSFKILD